MLQNTGWAVTLQGGAVYKTGETRCVTFQTGHVKIIAGQAKGMSDVVKILGDEGILAI